MRRHLESVLAPLLRVQPSIRLYRASLDIRSRYQFSFYDALIVAAALEAGCSRLYTEDMQHGQQIQDVYERLLRHGARKLNPPIEGAPGKWVCYLQDPDGNWIELIELTTSGH